MKKFILSSLSLFLTISILSGCSHQSEEEIQKFNDFINQEFIDTLESSYFDLHSTCEDPNVCGVDINDVNIQLGYHYDEKALKNRKAEIEETIKTLESFHRDQLSESQQDLYDSMMFEYDIAQDLAEDDFMYYDSLFSSMNGLQFQIASTLADWEFRNEQDIPPFITLVNDILPSMDSALKYTIMQQEKGYLRVDFDTIIDYCNQIIEKQENSSILHDLYKRIDALHLSETKSASYKEELKQAYLNSFLPAYQNIVSTMETLKQKDYEERGLSSLKHGKKYYELLLKNNIGSNKSVIEIKEMMKKKYMEHLFKMASLLENNPDLQTTMTSLPTTSFQTYQDIVDFLGKQMRNDFPSISDLSYDIQNINEDLNPDTGIAAYFKIPTLDATTPKQLRVNPNIGDINSLSTYATIAHEGYPGHMYQFAYVYENLDSNYAKRMNHVLAYNEGFAVYSEMFAYQYLEDINPAQLNLIMENELAMYCAIILADIGIHYDGWTYDEYVAEMIGYGIFTNSNQEGALETYRQLLYNPCAYQPYYVGYHEFMDLKKKAKDALDDDFDDKEFHEAILESGSVPFEVVERHVDAYIEENE